MDASAFQNAQAFETLSVGATAVGITEAIRAPGGVPCTWARLSVETQAVRYRLDGIAPTASVGHPLATGVTIDIYGEANVRNLRIIAQTPTASVSVTTGTA